MTKESYEEKIGIYLKSKMEDLLKKEENIVLKGNKRDVYLGIDFPIKVNTNIGVSEEKNHYLEIEKL